MTFPNELLADSAVGPQHLIDHTTDFISECGMALNNAKLYMVTSFVDRGQTVVDAGATFSINGQLMRAFSRENSWTYLGIAFSIKEQRMPPTTCWYAEPLSQRLTNAPLSHNSGSTLEILQTSRSCTP